MGLWCCTGQDHQVTTDSGLTYEILVQGRGSAVAAGDTVLINESMSYPDGTLLFSTDQIGHPVRFTVGASQVIDGIDEGVRGMRKGEVRKMIVPPHLSTRKEYPGNLHPDSTLLYKVELVEIIGK